MNKPLIYIISFCVVAAVAGLLIYYLTSKQSTPRSAKQSAKPKKKRKSKPKKKRKSKRKSKRGRK